MICLSQKSGKGAFIAFTYACMHACIPAQNDGEMCTSHYQQDALHNLAVIIHHLPCQLGQTHMHVQFGLLHNHMQVHAFLCC